jgi:hypothetical protein
VGRLEDAEQKFRAALRADPFSAVATSLLSYTYHLRRMQDSARAVSDRALLLDSMSLTARNLGARVRMEAGDLKGADALVPALNDNNAGVFVQVRIALGDTAGAMAVLHALEAENPRNQNVESVRINILMSLKDTTHALAAMEKATEDGEIWFMSNALDDPRYDFLRGTAGFATRLRRLGLPASLAVVPSRSRSR